MKVQQLFAEEIEIIEIVFASPLEDASNTLRLNILVVSTDDVVAFVGHD